MKNRTGEDAPIKRTFLDDAEALIDPTIKKIKGTLSEDDYFLLRDRIAFVLQENYKSIRQAQLDILESKEVV